MAWSLSVPITSKSGSGAMNIVEVADYWMFRISTVPAYAGSVGPPGNPDYGYLGRFVFGPQGAGMRDVVVVRYTDNFWHKEWPGQMRMHWILRPGVTVTLYIAYFTP